MRAFVRLVRHLSAVCGVVAVLCLAAALLVVCEMVTARYVFGVPTIWQTEFVLYAVVAATLMGSPYVLAAGGHVNVDLAEQHLSRRGTRRLRLLASACGLLFCATLTFGGWHYFYEAWTQGWVTESVWAPPLWIVLLPLPLGLGVLTLQYLADAIGLLLGTQAS